MDSSSERSWPILAALVLFAVVGVTQVAAVLFARPAHVDTQLEDGPVVVLVFATNGTRADRELSSAVRAAIDSTRAFATRRQMRFSTVGIDIGWSTSSAFEFLKHFGDFDELTVGRRWMNTGAERFISALGGEQALPQLAIFYQDVHASSAPFSITPPATAIRLLGRDGIAAWVKEGSKVPPPRDTQK